MIRWCSLCVVMMSAFTTLSQAATITVRKDGTGDYTVLYLAISGAADGDTILIGPGEFTETTSVRLPEWGTNVLTHGDVHVHNLTIMGAGEGVTVIGPPSYSWDATYGPHGLSMARMDHELSMSDLTIRSCYACLYFKGTLRVQRCEFRNCETGIWATLAGPSNPILNSRFVGHDVYPTDGILTWRTNASAQVEDCEFSKADAYVTNADVTFRRCRFDGGNSGILVMNGARGHVWDSDITNVRWGLWTYLGWPASQCDIHESRIAGTYAALVISQHTTATVQGSVLTGGSNAVVQVDDADGLVINGCDFVKGEGPILRCSRPAAWGAVVYEATNNFWGTADETQIRDWIIDSSDDANIFATVHYSPFSGQSVPTESTTWGGLKALFR